MERNRQAARRPTINDVAKLAGVSAMTVSRVVNAPQDVSENKRNAVLDAIARLRYVPNKAAASLQRSDNRMVALLLPDISPSLFHQIYRGLNAVLESAGYLVLIGESHYDLDREFELARSMLSWRPAGFVFGNILRDSRTVGMLAQAGVPLCLIADPDLERGDMVVGYSTFRIGAAVARYLFRSGRKRVAFVRSTKPYTRNTEHMLAGAKSVVTEHPGCEISIIGVPKTSPLSFEDGAAIVRSLGDDPNVDALVFANDVPAAGAVAECGRRGIRVPDQLAIVGFGDSDLASVISPALTSVDVDAEGTGRSAGSVLLNHMTNPSAPPHIERVDFKLVVRETA